MENFGGSQLDNRRSNRVVDSSGGTPSVFGKFSSGKNNWLDFTEVSFCNNDVVILEFWTARYLFLACDLLKWLMIHSFPLIDWLL